MIAIKVLLTSSTLVYQFQFDLNRSRHLKSAECYENICKLFWQGWVIFLREVIFYTQFSIIFIMIKVSKNICFKIIGSHHTLNIIVLCKTFVAKEPIYRTYCGVYPLWPDFKAFSFSILLSEVRTKGKEERISLYVLFDAFYIFYLRLLETFLKKRISWHNIKILIAELSYNSFWDSKLSKKHNELMLNAVKHSCKVKIHKLFFIMKEVSLI